MEGRGGGGGGGRGDGKAVSSKDDSAFPVYCEDFHAQRVISARSAEDFLQEKKKKTKKKTKKTNPITTAKKPLPNYLLHWKLLIT